MISIQLLCCCYLNYCKINLQYKRCWNLWYLFLYQSIWKIIFSTGRKYKQILLMSHRLKGGDMFWSHKHMQKAVSKVCFEWKKIFCINSFLFKTVFFTFCLHRSNCDIYYIWICSLWKEKNWWCVSTLHEDIEKMLTIDCLVKTK